jgi:SH3-like domain-containing protein
MRAGPDRVFAWWAPVVWGPAVAGGVLVGVALGTSFIQAQDRRAVVTAEEAGLRATPSETASPDSMLPGGTMVEVEAPRNAWRRVRLGDGTGGWVSAAALDEI